MKKGFTLIELLAVILILGIIALIAIPTVNNILKESRMGAFKSSVNNISKSISEKCTTEQIKNQELTTLYVLRNGKSYPTLDIQGDIPNGQIFVDNNCDVTFTIYDNNFIANKFENNNDIIIKELTNSVYYDSNLNGADPVLDYGMIPVEIENNGDVLKANIQNKWYDYNNKQWANAVLVKEDVRLNYLNMDSGEKINNEDILGYFVWVPRFKYAIPSGTGAREIKVIFEDIYNPKSYGAAIDDDYYTHPAFTFGNIELNGFWFSKFEISGNANNPKSLPNVTSINNQTVQEQFNSSLLMKGKVYGINGNSHMMKNTEWGATVYLSRSKYGINSEIRINNVTPVTTGCGANSDNEGESSTCAISYGGATSYPQTTTGNISGVFDISGGRFERVMATYSLNEKLPGFSSIIDKKYYDLYTTLDPTTACEGSICKGHALSETQSWYGDYYITSNASRTWIHRGGLYLNNSVAGAFFTDANSGGAGSTYRIVINSSN